jgi:hypothetical protein
LKIYPRGQNRDVGELLFWELYPMNLKALRAKRPLETTIFVRLTLPCAVFLKYANKSDFIHAAGVSPSQASPGTILKADL